MKSHTSKLVSIATRDSGLSLEHSVLGTRVAAVRQENKSNPLKESIIVRLTMLSEVNVPTPFELSPCVIGTVKIAQIFGVDAFQAQNYDTWALLTLLHRICSDRGVQPTD